MPRGDVTLVCFPHAGGAATTYIPLSQHLAPELDVVAVQYPGRQDRRHEPPIAQLPRLAELIATALLPDLSGPYAFFGHSMGALVAYETARVLREQGARRPERLFLSARGAPGDRPDPGDAMTDADVLTTVGRLGGRGTEALSDPEMRAMVLPALQADYRALAAYAHLPGAPLNCAVSVLTGDADPVVHTEAALGWRTLFAGEFRAHRFVGGHFYLEEEVAAVAALVRADLRRPSAG
ncbi:thioesterase II family protein [Streptomyces catenulae]|uniref:Alpha/beta fold hydrolase n=1 Tax=Streptomyces catenulae TaxID=66875 RepID=A0ABV2Z1W3_9ACTN|nr:alpha/beta fold hydrolase [Streptomyces catenulae]